MCLKYKALPIISFPTSKVTFMPVFIIDHWGMGDTNAHLKIIKKQPMNV